MWFMNKIANPFVRLILRSPLHGLMSAAVLSITYRGKKSGKEYTLPVQYAQEGKVIYIVPGKPEQKTWWRNLRGGAPVKLTLRGKSVSGQALVLQGESDSQRIAEALLLYLQKFPMTAQMHDVRVSEKGDFNLDDIRRVSDTLVMVNVDLA
jgi:deazaflavin-dependent oxidoreductase (nitroreductase family)